jgi:glyoxylase-like metal-dependent hydrolase (beta-lactamase superfamily II)
LVGSLNKDSFTK